MAANHLTNFLDKVNVVMEVEEMEFAQCVTCDTIHPANAFTAFPSSLCAIGMTHGPSVAVCNGCTKGQITRHCFRDDGNVAVARCIHFGCGKSLARVDVERWLTPEELERYDGGMIRNHINWRKCQCGSEHVYENPGDVVTCSECGEGICFECEEMVTATHDCSIYAGRSIRSLRRHILEDPYLGTRNTDRPDDMTYLEQGRNDKRVATTRGWRQQRAATARGPRPPKAIKEMRQSFRRTGRRTS